MSNINKWFSTAMARDTSYRQSQQRPLFHSGTNKVSLGKTSPGIDKQKLPPKSKRFIAGESLAGGEDVAG